MAGLSGLTIGDFELTWLNGGRFELDGGAMFGVVPKVLWSKKFPSDEDNYVPHVAWPLLVKTAEALILIDTGLGNKLDDKGKRIFRIGESWRIVEDLNSLGLQRGDVDFVILTHFDWDHAGGVVSKDDDNTLSLTFPRARHIIQAREWEDVLNPTMRSKHTYWPVNYEVLKESPLLEFVDGEREVTKGVTVVHTGGHSRGHQIVILESKGQKALHLADLLPTHAHFNPLWVMAYDNYPMESIDKKRLWEDIGIKDNAWFTFYHDPSMLACKFDKQGNAIERLAMTAPVPSADDCGHQ